MVPATHQRGGDDATPPTARPSLVVVVAVAVLIVLLMAFALIAGLLGQPGLATLAGGTAVPLVAVAVHHLLGRPTNPPTNPDDPGITPGG
jgi:hypothetical protein